MSNIRYKKSLYRTIKRKLTPKSPRPVKRPTKEQAKVKAYRASATQIARGRRTRG